MVVLKLTLDILEVLMKSKLKNVLGAFNGSFLTILLKGTKAFFISLKAAIWKKKVLETLV